MEKFYSFNKAFISQALTPVYLVTQLGVSSWIRIAIYLALDYVISPADLINKFLPASHYTEILSSLSTIVLTIAIYILPELKEVTNKNQNLSS